MSFAYQLKITIQGSKPPIWRRVLVPNGITFRDLDDIIEEIFGWTHSHLYSFDFPNGYHIMVDYESPENDDTTMYIDRWMEHKTFSYTYDFGDNWTHKIQVEHVIDRQERYPQVLKAKGPNMIEDCGGIWGFNNHKEEAEDFDLDCINKKLREWEYPENPLSYEDEMEQYYQEMEMTARNMTEQPETLIQVLMDYPKDMLTTIARHHHLQGYSKYNKRELVFFLNDQLLNSEYMENMIQQTSFPELDLMENAIQKKGVLASEDFVSHSLFLCTYGAFSRELPFFQIPKDVAKEFRTIYTNSLKVRIENLYMTKIYLQGVVYLYGVISLNEAKEIFCHYKKGSLKEEMLTEAIKNLCDENVIVFQNSLLIDENLAEESSYQFILEERKKYPPYIPEDFEEIFLYGLHKCQLPQEEIVFFLDYLQNILHFDKETCFEIFVVLTEEIRMNADDMDYLSLFENFGYYARSKKKKEELLNEIRTLSKYIRKWEFYGHTFAEIQNIENASSQTESKIIPISKGKKKRPQ